jgi:hypothetical protein
MSTLPYVALKSAIMGGALSFFFPSIVSIHIRCIWVPIGIRYNEKTSKFFYIVFGDTITKCKNL